MTIAGTDGYVAVPAPRSMAGTNDRGTLPVSGGELYYERAGEGPALVLVHSAFLDSRMWDPQMSTFTRHHTVIRYDVRGHGKSTGTEGRVPAVDDLTALLNHLEVRQAFIIGNSNGGRIACEFAAGFPDRTRGIVLAASGPHDFEPTKEEEARFMDAFPDGEGVLVEHIKAGRREAALEMILQLWAPMVPDSQRAWVQGIARDNYDALVHFLNTEGEGPKTPYPVAARLEKGGTPILALGGAHDMPALNMMLGRFAQQTPSAHYVELPNGDHTMSLSSRAEFETNVLEFLAAVEGGGPWPPPRN